MEMYKMRYGKKQFNIYIREDIIEYLTKAAADVGISRSQLSEDLINLGIRCVLADDFERVLDEYRKIKRGEFDGEK